MSVLQTTIDSVNDVNTATAVAPVLQVAEPPRRFPAAMLRPRVDPRLPPAPVQALIRIGNCVVSISAQQYMGLDEPRRDQIRQRHIINLENLHKMLILEATSLDWEHNCALKSLAERQGHGPQSATQYMDMIRDAADPPAPYVALERDARFLDPMLVVQEADFVPSDFNFKYQDEEARRYRATVALMMHRYFEGCGSWTNYPGYHSFAHSVMPLTELDHSVLAALLDRTICDILAVASTGPSALRAATQLEKQRCMQYLYGAMAKAALAKDMKVEPLFLSLATELVVNDSTNSLDDHMDLPETITQQLRELLKSFDLDAKAQDICRTIEQMTTEEYHIPPVQRFCPTGVAGKPFWWDLFGHFNLQSVLIAHSLFHKVGRAIMLHHYGLGPDDVVKEIMHILCPLVRYYGGGRSYDNNRELLMTTLDLDEEVHHITGAFIHHRSYQSASVGAGDHESAFVAERITSLANHHMVSNRSVSPGVLRQCGWTRQCFGKEISRRLHSLVTSNKQLRVRIRPISTIVCDLDMQCMVNELMSLRHQLNLQPVRLERIVGYPASPFYLEFSQGSPNRWGERIQEMAREYLSYRPNLRSFPTFEEAPFLLQLEEELALRVQMLAAEYRESTSSIRHDTCTLEHDTVLQHSRRAAWASSSAGPG
ncbi:MAG: hypothetical protein EBU88_15320, partial [Acidobacteria bacterium]|nr:hypothetical protein [Acidobacteriota bacterium]